MERKRPTEFPMSHATRVTDLVGGTPTVDLGTVCAGFPGSIVAKLEYLNPCGSVKDRLGLALIDDLEDRGLLEPGDTGWC